MGLFWMKLHCKISPNLPYFWNIKSKPHKPFVWYNWLFIQFLHWLFFSLRHKTPTNREREMIGLDYLDYLISRTSTLYLGTSLMYYKWDRVTSYSTIFYASYIDREHLSPEQHLAT